MSETEHTKHLPSHEATYANFIRGSIGLCLYCTYILVALCAFAFGGSFSNLLGFLTLVFGLIAVLIDLRSGSNWYLSGGLLVVFGLLTGINVS